MSAVSRVVFAIFLCLPMFGARFSIEHVSKLVRVADAQISPTGKCIVAVVSRPNYEEILSNTGDYRVTVTQSYKLYHLLKDNGVTAQFVAYPIPGRDVDRRWIGWLEKFLDAGPAPQSGGQ